MKCPNCNHKLYKGEKGESYCKYCGFLNKGFDEEDYITDVEDKKHERYVYKTGGSRRTP